MTVCSVLIAGLMLGACSPANSGTPATGSLTPELSDTPRPSPPAPPATATQTLAATADPGPTAAGPAMTATAAPSGPAAGGATPAPTPSAVPASIAVSTPAAAAASAVRTAAPLATRAPVSAPSVSATADPAIRAGQIITRGGAAMVAVPAGEFHMGSQGDLLASANETPQHTVYLDSFWLDREAVTNALYARCVTAGACTPPFQSRSNSRDKYYGSAEYADYPVLYVSWSDAQTYCGWAGKRLPAEAEWEKAARGSDGRLYPWGQTFDAARLNSAEAGPGDTMRVGSFPGGASAYGALDMAGNAWQWVADVYQADYYRLSPAINPKGPAGSLPASEATGVLRGGAWNNNQRAVRSAYRLAYFQRHVGFEATIRCAG